MDPLDLELLEEFVGEAAQNLEIALERLENGAPLFVWPGDLRFESDVSSEELLARCPGLRTPTR